MDSLINIYNVWLLIPLYLFCYFTVLRVNAKTKRIRFEEGNKRAFFSNKQNRIKRKYIFGDWTFNIISNKDNALRKQGYPLGLTGYTYYPVKLGLFFVCFLPALINYNSVATSLIIGLIGGFSPDIYVLVNSHIRNNSLKEDLMNAADCLCLQLSANMTLKDALRGIHEICVNRDAKKAFIRLSAEYELTGHNIEIASDNFKNSFEILEADLFSAALKQQIFSGSSQETLTNLAELLREGYLDRLNIKTKMKNVYVIVGVIVIMINIVVLTMFPIFVDVGEGMRKIFS